MSNKTKSGQQGVGAVQRQRDIPPLPTLQPRDPVRWRREGHCGHQAAHRHGLHEILSRGRSEAEEDRGLQGFHIH